MTLGSAILRQEVHENEVEGLIYITEKADNLLKKLVKLTFLCYFSLEK